MLRDVLGGCLPEHGVAGKKSGPTGETGASIFKNQLKTARSLTSRTGQRNVLAATGRSYPVLRIVAQPVVEIK
jgi:hypothetical protein